VIYGIGSITLSKISLAKRMDFKLIDVRVMLSKGKSSDDTAGRASDWMGRFE
jgi:hypothetical protein